MIWGEGLRQSDVALDGLLSGNGDHYMIGYFKNIMDKVEKLK